MFFEGFNQFEIEVCPGVTISGVHGGNGPPLLLLHGFPQSHHIWHRVAPELSKTCTVIAMDLRGYGASSKPKGDDKHSQYAKSAMAADCASLMSKLGHESFLVCAHDRGARVAHKLCVDFPKRVKKAIFLDIAPTLAMYTKTDQEFATAYYHWFFLIQKTPFPENMILADPKVFLDGHMGNRYAGLGVFHPDTYKYYLKVMGESSAIHGMCEDYRAAASVDMEEAKDDIKNGRQIQCPLRVLWGKYGVIEKCFDAVKEWQSVSSSSVEGEAVDSGHYIPEELPDVLLKHVKEFLV